MAARRTLFAFCLAAIAACAGAALAAEPLRIRVLTYNIHHGEGVDGKLDLERIAAVIRAAEPDLVALQELDQGTTRTRRVDQPAELARLCQLHVAFGKNLDFQGGGYGNAVLSRWPIRKQHNQPLPAPDKGEPRGVLEVDVELPGGRTIGLWATHLAALPSDRERVASAQAINQRAAARPELPLLLAGDLNDTPTSPTLKLLGEKWQRAGDTPLSTVPVRAPRRQIDYVLFRPADAWKVIDVRVLDEALASDHRPLIALLELP